MKAPVYFGLAAVKLARVPQHGRHALVRVLVPVFLVVSLASARSDLRFVEPRVSAGQVQLGVHLPDEPRQIVLEQASSLTSPHWQAVAVQRPASGQPQTVFAVALPTNMTAQFFRCRATTNYAPADLRLRMLYNGYFLTVDPKRALSAISTNDRYRLYVLNALLVNPASGRIAAIWPPFDGDYPGETNVARHLSEVPGLAYEHPPAPGNNPTAIKLWWLAHGVAPALLQNLDAVDLQGAVVTPGLIDNHFHVSIWAKKVPAEGERFGWLPDVSDPIYFSETNGLGRRPAQEALTAIVADANTYLTNGSGVVLHGFTYTWLAEDPDTGEPMPSYLFDCAETNVLNEDYLLNGIGLTNGGFTPRPAVLVQVSGQSCWYNGALLDHFNDLQTNVLANRFPSVPVASYTPPGAGEVYWTFNLATGPTSSQDIYDLPLPLDVDLRLPAGPGEEPPLVPFTLQLVDSNTWTAAGLPVLSQVATQMALPPVSGASIIPFYRPIPPAITTQIWNEAAAFAGAEPETDGAGYGYWDPRKPYKSNWYSGAERGLLQYFFDPTGGVWRATGYAEHYVMRDLLTGSIQSSPTVADNMQMRRNLACWCQRHGLTSVHDIMYYRRRVGAAEFQAYEALSSEHSPATEPEFFTRRNLDPATQTGRLGLRVGLYYYIETMAEVDEAMALATDPAWGFDQDRLVPAPSHPEYPGWVRWLGWKLQLDGAMASRNLFSSAPTAKPYPDETDPYTTTNETGQTVQFRPHGYGLLTESSEPEQEFSSRESAALYWLVRESDPASPFHNPAIPRNWAILKSGVVNWIGQTINTNALATDLEALTHVNMTGTNADGRPRAAALADKLARVGVQINDGYQRMLTSLAKIWYERSKAAAASNPIPHQVACHCAGDGGVDLYLKAIQNLRDDLTSFPSVYSNLPPYWQSVIPPGADLGVVIRSFTNERYRVEHLQNVSGHMAALVRSPGSGLDDASRPDSRNVVFSSQPVILALDGQSSRTTAYPQAQELWPLPAPTNYWCGLPAIPRYDHHHAGPLYLGLDIPYALSTDPPSIRDPRPALTLIGAVARCPTEIDAAHWLDQTGPEPDRYPPDYLVKGVYPPLGLVPNQNVNPMRMTIEQALCGMTFWAAYGGNSDREVGALASPLSDPDGPGWLADLVVWQCNPLAIRVAGNSLEDLATRFYQIPLTNRTQLVNTFIQKFRPALTAVAGMPVYVAPGTEARWQGSLP